MNSKLYKRRVRIYYTCSKLRLTEKAFPLIPTLTLEHKMF